MSSQVSFEFVISVGVMLSLISFIVITSERSVSRIEQQLLFEKKRAIAWQLSELFLSHPGYPRNWSDLNEVKVLGFSTGERGVFSLEKIMAINSCSPLEYESLLDKLGLRESSFVLSFYLISEDGKIKLSECSPPVISKLASRAKITRLGVLENQSLIEMEVVLY